MTKLEILEVTKQLYDVLQELEESSSYWSEYDVPLGIQDRIKGALERAKTIVK